MQGEEKCKGHKREVIPATSAYFTWTCPICNGHKNEEATYSNVMCDDCAKKQNNKYKKY